jgi:protein-L-isoaspartate(D-aspartate) O-methyltransferase
MTMNLVRRLLVTAGATAVVFSCAAGGDSEEMYLEARERMVKEQIEHRGIHDERVLEALLKVKRHLFVPEAYRDLAYQDRPLPIGEGQTISQPYIVALMTSHLNITPEDRVLEIGTGSGYQAAVLAELAQEVYTIEIVESLAIGATQRLHDLGYANVRVKCDDGFFGWEEYAPFDAIIVTCAAPRMPELLVAQLGDGGRMILPLGDDPFLQSLTVVTKRGDTIEQQRITEVIFVPMTGEIERETR